MSQQDRLILLKTVVFPSEIFPLLINVVQSGISLPLQLTMTPDEPEHQHTLHTEANGPRHLNGQSP